MTSLMDRPAAARVADADTIARQVHERVGRRLATLDGQLTGADLEEHGRVLIREELDAHTRTALATGEPVLEHEAEKAVAGRIFAGLFRLGAFQTLLDDDLVENIMVNGHDRVFVVRDGQPKIQVDPVAASDEELVDVVRQIASRAGSHERRFDRGSPILDLQLADGSRLHAALDVSKRPSITIRRHRHKNVTLRDLVRLGVIDDPLAQVLAACVRARMSIIVGGGPGVGKTTMLRALATEIDPDDRLITIEDTYELGLDEDTVRHPDVVAFQKREANVEGVGEVSQADLIRAALRMSPQRVIVGEARGPEVIQLLEAMSIGLDGSLATVHTSGSMDSFARLASMAMNSPMKPSLEGANLLIAGAVDLVLHLGHTREVPRRRVVTSIREVTGADGRMVISNEIYRAGRDGRAMPGAPWTSSSAERLVDAGLDPDLLTNGRGWAA
jgi:pilus assembly protein CpaF